MTATTTPARSSAPRGPAPGALTGTGTLLRFLLRRDRIRLPAWAAGFGLFMLYLITAIPAAYGDGQDLAAATRLFDDPVGRLLAGPGYGLDEPTLERFVAGGYGLYLLLLAALMSLLLVTRHTRAEEQSGRAELVQANVVGRHAALTATLLAAALANLAAAVAVATVMLAVGGFGVAGSLLFASGIATVGLVFAGVGSLTAQVTEYSRAASGLSGAALGVAFLLRAGGDVAEEGGSALSWLSPLAWGQQTAPFVLDRWWPLALPLGLAALTATVGYLLAARRDLGAGLVAVRPGRPRAAPWLGSPLGLALRLQRAGIVGWTLSLTVGGLTFGGYTDALLAGLGDMPEAFVELFGADDLVAGYLGYMAVFMSFLAAVYAVLAVQRLRTEETDGRAEPLLATPVSRGAWLAANLAVTSGGVVVLMIATGAGTGVGAAIVTGERGHVVDLVGAHLGHVPAVLVVLGIAILLLGALPRALPLAWAIVGYGLLVGTFGPVLGLPPVAEALSPFAHAAQLPLEPFAPAPLAVLTLVAVATAALGTLAVRRRDLGTG